MMETATRVLSRWTTTGLLASVALFFSGTVTDGAPSGFRPGQPWLDTDGIHINAHGNNVLKHEGKYYWYGSHKIAGKTESEKNEAGVRCYVSSDLLNWSNQGLVLSVTSAGQHPEVADAGILDRPKVVFNPATRKFVMYFKLYPPEAAGGMKGTEVAYLGVATAGGPLENFEYQGKFTGAGSPSGSGDFAIFQEDDGTAYHIAVRKPDKSLVCGRLTEDGLRPAGDYVVMDGVTRSTEAPALFRRNGKIYLLGSGSTGWDPNPARMFVADKIAGPYQPLGNPCVGVNPHNRLGPGKAFGGQSTFVMPAPWSPDEWIAMFDIWNPKDPINAGYIWLPLLFEKDKPVIRWQDEWQPESVNPRDAHLIALNQVGYEAGRPKRFTAHLSADDTTFIVRPAKGGDALFRAMIRGNIGDFSALDAPSGEYVIEVRGGSLKPGTSDPFLIQPDLWKDLFWQPAVDFLIDSRSVVGTHPSAFGGCPWRDGTYYDAILPSLVLLQRADPDRYLTAALKQAEWVAENLDWNDPRTTKGHRMSEHRTIPNLVWLLQNYPDHAPAGLKEKITAWAEVAAKRSDNPWDIRRYDDGDHWTIPKLNDVGNWAATPGIALAASQVIEDPALKSRMREIAVSHADAIFGRNPRLAAAPNKPEAGVTGIERGWPVAYKDNVCARLELCRGSISSAPGSEMFPFNPDGTYRHPEGWVNYGAAWCLSLAYFEFDRRAGKAP